MTVNITIAIGLLARTAGAHVASAILTSAGAAVACLNLYFAAVSAYR